MQFLYRLNNIVGQIKYKDWRLVVGIDGSRFYLQWEFKAPDWTSDDRKTLLPWKSRKWHLSEHMTENEIVQTALAAALTAEEHEAREAFAYMGVRLFHPHISIAALMDAARSIDVRQNPAK